MFFSVLAIRIVSFAPCEFFTPTVTDKFSLEWVIINHLVSPGLFCVSSLILIGLDSFNSLFNPQFIKSLQFRGDSFKWSEYNVNHSDISNRISFFKFSVKVYVSVHFFFLPSFSPCGLLALQNSLTNKFYCYLTPLRFFFGVGLADGFSLEFEGLQVSLSLRDSSQYSSRSWKLIVLYPFSYFQVF